MTFTTEQFEHVFEAFQQPVRRFVEHPGALLASQRLQALAAAMGLGRQEAFETEPVRGQTGGAEGGDQGAGAGDRGHQHTGFAGLAYQMKARIGNQRCARIGDQRHILARQQTLHQSGTLVPFVVIMTGGGRGGDTEVLQQASAVPGVFGGDQADRAQHLEGARGDVLQIADRRGDNVKGTGVGRHGRSCKCDV